MKVNNSSYVTCCERVFHNKCLNCQPCIQFSFRELWVGHDILSVMTEVNVQIPGRDFSEDHLFLVTSEISNQKEIPVVVGTYFIASLSEYLKTLEKDVFDELDQAIQQGYYSWEEAAKIRDKYGCEPPLGVVKTSKPVTIYAGERKEIHVSHPLLLRVRMTPHK